MTVFYYVWLGNLLERLMPLWGIGISLLLLYFAILAVKQIIREAAIETIEIYRRIHSARQDVIQRDSEIEAQIATFKAKLEADRQLAQLQLADHQALLKSGLPPTVNERFASGEFDIEID